MSAQPLAAPFPWFGGKRRAAPIVWSALGDPGGYVEPFCGSAATLLARPGTDRAGWRRVETLNDADGWLVNAWRAIRADPEAVAEHCWGPVAEIDYHARLAWLQERRTEGLVSWLEGDPEAYDSKAAGWWLYVVACGIGNPFDPGPWRVVDGRLTDTHNLPAGTGINRKLPHLGDAGQGINRELPHLGDAGQGINRELPHLGDAGKGRLIGYLASLADRLERVRITCGDWRRILQPSVLRATSGAREAVGVFLDPPYIHGHHYYATGHARTISEDVREWCLTALDLDLSIGSGPAPELRIVLAGYDTDHDELLDHGWRKTNGKAGGNGYNTDPLAGRRERLWLSPHCLDDRQGGLW